MPERINVMAMVTGTVMDIMVTDITTMNSQGKEGCAGFSEEGKR
jgi:hypothetical protein